MASASSFSSDMIGLKYLCFSYFLHSSANELVVFSYLSNGSNADSCFSRVCVTQVFLNFVSSAMASSFSVTASAENVFLMNFSKGFLKSTLSVRFSGRFIQPVMSSAAKLFVSPLFLSKFFLPSIEKILEAIFGSLHGSKPVPLG